MSIFHCALCRYPGEDKNLEKADFGRLTPPTAGKINLIHVHVQIYQKQQDFVYILHVKISVGSLIVCRFWGKSVTYWYYSRILQTDSPDRPISNTCLDTF